MSPTISLTTMFVHHKSADYDSHRHLYHTRHIGCYGGDLSSYVMSQLSGKHMQTLWLIAHKGMYTHNQEKYNILEKTWLVCHVVVLQHFPPLPLELLYPLFLLLSSFCVPLL